MGLTMGQCLEIISRKHLTARWKDATRPQFKHWGQTTSYIHKEKLSTEKQPGYPFPGSQGKASKERWVTDRRATEPHRKRSTTHNC